MHPLLLPDRLNRWGPSDPRDPLSRLRPWVLLDQSSLSGLSPRWPLPDLLNLLDLSVLLVPLNPSHQSVLPARLVLSGLRDQLSP